MIIDWSFRHIFLLTKLFFLVFTCTLFSTQAATVIITKNKTTEVEPQNKNNIFFSTPALPPLESTQNQLHFLEDDIPSSSIFSLKQSISTPQSSPLKNQGIQNTAKTSFTHELKNIGEEFLLNHAENELIQDSFITLLAAKQVYQQTNINLNNLAQDIFTSIELNPYIQTNLLLHLDIKTLPSQQLSSLSSHSSTSITEYQKRVNNHQYSIDDSNSPIPHIIKNLFKLSTLVYLSIIIIFLIIFKQLLRLFLFRNF